jgi:hypothetical protein
LWVEPRGFTWRNTEETGIELVDPGQHTGRESYATSGLAPFGVLQFSSRPTRRIDLGNEVLSVQQSLPERLFIPHIPGKTKGDANNGDGLDINVSGLDFH